MTTCPLDPACGVEYDVAEVLALSSWGRLPKALLREFMDLLRIEPDIVTAKSHEMFGRRAIDDKERAKLWDAVKPW